MTSKRTKSYKTLAVATSILSILLNLSPLIAGTAYAFYVGEPQEKFTLGLTITVAAILSVYNIVAKMKLRSVLWVILLGVSICLTNIKQLLIVMCICTLVDELVLTPLAIHFRAKASINKEIDARM